MIHRCLCSAYQSKPEPSIRTGPRSSRRGSSRIAISLGAHCGDGFAAIRTLPRIAAAFTSELPVDGTRDRSERVPGSLLISGRRLISTARCPPQAASFWEPLIVLPTRRPVYMLSPQLETCSNRTAQQKSGPLSCSAAATHPSHSHVIPEGGRRTLIHQSAVFVSRDMESIPNPRNCCGNAT